MKKALFVAWRSGEPHGWGPVGKLEYVYESKLYRFCYVRGARTLPGFQLFPGMDDLEQVYESEDLFPLFANRLLSKARKDEYVDFLRWGGFESDQPPDPIAVLSVTEGIRQTDAIEVFPCPVPDLKGCYLNKFFLHGIHRMGPAAMERIQHLQPNERLFVKPEAQNAADPNAVGVYTSEGMKIGYVPRYFARDVRRLLNECSGNFLELFVERVNLDAPLQHRVLCRINACWPVGFEPCRGEEFLPIPSGIAARCE